ncbi:MAG TPA: aminoacyl-tRNA hydrolase [Actinomycetota bacterium]|nr:aminoacyl-tRNA hydrolase [Actinomycetota bacterium]
MSAWLVVGLGNPGDRYAETRHNIGARVVERLADRLQVRLKKVRFVAVAAGEANAEGSRLILLRPLTFMNVSGPPVASLTRKRKIDVDHVVACHDEIDLAFGSLKVKLGGSTAGHRGLDSLRQALRTPDYYRVRLGVGRPPGRKDPADYVLEPFAKAERVDVDLLVEEGADAVLTLVREGLAAAQDRHNRTVPQ